MIELNISMGADVNKQKNNGQTPLHSATESSNCCLGLCVYV